MWDGFVELRVWRGSVGWDWVASGSVGLDEGALGDSGGACGGDVSVFGVGVSVATSGEFSDAS